jgi:hypothetical protein
VNHRIETLVAGGLLRLALIAGAVAVLGGSANSEALKPFFGAADLTCGPPRFFLGTPGRGPKVVSTTVVHDEGHWGVRHTMEDGRVYSRVDQYYVQEATGEHGLSWWHGYRVGNPHLWMSGGLFQDQGHVWYEEQIVDLAANKPIGRTMQDCGPITPVVTSPPAPTYSAPPPVIRAGNDDSVPITMIHRSIHVIVTVGGRPLDMILDTGANVSSIPPSLANNLIAAGRAEGGPSVPITLANGATEEERTVFVDSLVIGRHARAKVLVSVSDGDPLLGLPILNSIGKFSIDAERGVLSFEGAVSASE